LSTLEIKRGLILSHLVLKSNCNGGSLFDRHQNNSGYDKEILSLSDIPTHTSDPFKRIIFATNDRIREIVHASTTFFKTIPVNDCIGTPLLETITYALKAILDTR